MSAPAAKIEAAKLRVNGIVLRLQRNGYSGPDTLKDYLEAQEALLALIGCAPDSSDSGIAGLPSAAQKSSHTLGLTKETDADQVRGGKPSESDVLHEIANWLDHIEWDSDHTERQAADYAEDLRVLSLAADLRALPPQVGCETDSAPSKAHVLEKKEDSGAALLPVDPSASPATTEALPTLETTRQAIVDALKGVIGARQAVDRLIAAAKQEERHADTR